MNHIKLLCKIAFNSWVSRFLDNEFHVTFALQLTGGFIRETTTGCGGGIIDRETVECMAENIGNAFREPGNYSHSE